MEEKGCPPENAVFLDDDSKIRFRLSFVLGRKSKIFSGRSLGPTKGLRVFVGK